MQRGLAGAVLADQPHDLVRPTSIDASRSALTPAEALADRQRPQHRAPYFTNCKSRSGAIDSATAPMIISPCTVCGRRAKCPEEPCR